MNEEIIPIPNPDCVRFIHREKPKMTDIEARVLKSLIIEQMYNLGFWNCGEFRVIPDITENPETILQFRRTDGAEVHIQIKR